ncbi:SDR family NAD(P)-dependent oxidoreductase [Streptomyces sp. BE20]|uniref:SDR family NAD(P)-dependent oxidoreductase n=1 Tax=Streptomyces sp. BE20 TaxID=3002525 RepID=UPI002E75D6A7|nr:SDR family NAD(P)-dependent oxidoreductase [Streptomyces sp. BE20]MEE1828588.1 SDR family NAD(P)-dependent oxidoreductase [Streptomyces sp. BE20]
MPRKVLVTGATGTVGNHLVRRLLKDGAEVRALVREPERAAALLPAGVHLAPGDLTDPAAVRAALVGVERAFVLLADDAGAAVAEALRDVPGGGPEHLVLLSAAAPAAPAAPAAQAAEAQEDPTQDAPVPDNPLFRKHRQGEAALAATGRPVTVLRPGPFASLTRQWIPAVRGAGVIGAVHPDLALPVVDPRDIADVAAAVLAGPAPAPGPLVLSGPQALDTHERVRILAEVTGRPLTVRRLSAEAWVRLAGDRLPEAYARALLGVEEYLRRVPPPLTGTVQEYTGRPARPFRAWVEDHAAEFLQTVSRTG